MPNQHKHSPTSVRLPGWLRQWVIDRHKSTGQPVNALIVGAVYRWWESETGGGEHP